MGGSKNKSPAQKERSQGAKKSDSKPKKGDKDGPSSPPAAEIRVAMTDAQAERTMRSVRTVTSHYLARQAGVKISAARAYLRDAAARGLVQDVGGTSGRRVYAVVGSRVPARPPGMASTIGTTSGSSKSK